MITESLAHEVVFYSTDEDLDRDEEGYCRKAYVIEVQRKGTDNDNH